jgi:deferrochelatase/peroxidase EfeB
VSRRGFFGVLGGATLGAAATASGIALSSSGGKPASATAIEPFYGPHQGGITTTPQRHTCLAAFDVLTEDRGELALLLREWTAVAAALTAGRPVSSSDRSPMRPEPDSGDAIGLGPARLTLNLGLGASLFRRHGVDRFGFDARRPAALVELPRFANDQLERSRTGGDLTLHACADDPQVAFHAVRQLARAADGVAEVRWSQTGFNETAVSPGTPRNLMGFKDGTVNPRSAAQMQRHVFVGPEGPTWMRGGTYLVVRRIRMALEHWDSERLSTQEAAVGRHKSSGAPLGATDEFAPLDLARLGSDGQPVIPLRAHVRLAASTVDDGQVLLRRSYSYNDGISVFSERWPPYARVPLFEAGLLFCAYQRDPRQAFIPIYARLSTSDALGRFTTHTGSALVALPPGVPGPGHFLAQDLFE